MKKQLIVNDLTHQIENKIKNMEEVFDEQMVNVNPHLFVDFERAKIKGSLTQLLNVLDILTEIEERFEISSIQECNHSNTVSHICVECLQEVRES